MVTTLNMECSKPIWIRAFQLACIVSVLILAFTQLQVYIDNKDQSSVGYRRFNDEEQDIYPAMSICLHSPHGGIFDEADEFLQVNKGLNGGQGYQNILLGNKNITDDIAKISFDNVTKNVFEDYVEVFFTMTKQGAVIDAWDPSMQDISTHPFFKSYQDPYFTCMTKKVHYVKNQILNFAALVFKASSLAKSNIENLLVYMHHDGQLTRQFGKQILQLTASNFNKAINGSSNYYTIHINQVEVLRKRSDGVVPCNDTLENDDMVWRENVMKKVGCIPEYWEKLHSNFHLMDDHQLPLNKCTTTEQFQHISSYYLPPKHTDNGTSLYIGPCNQMGITASVTQSDLKEENLVLGFSYVVEEYRETINRRAFSFKSLWSAVGGFIGMFLGCGLLQVFVVC